MRAAIMTATALMLAVTAACGERTKTPAAPEPSVSIEPAPFDPGASAAEQAVLAGCASATVAGFCGVVFGGSPDQAKAAFPVALERYSGDADVGTDPNACFELFAAEPVQGVTFLVEDGKVGRVDVMSEGVTTSDGFGIGSAARDIRAKYGAVLSEQPNKYEPEVTELVVEQGGGKLIYEIQGGHVRAWRAGIAPTIDYVEHCG